MPHMRLIRPADANEVAEAWRLAVERDDGPNMIILTRQKIPIFDRRTVAPAEGLRRGAYVIRSEDGGRPDLILIGTGSEVHLCLAARERLAEEGIDARVVSMPSWEYFREQEEAYRREVLPPEVTARLAVEAAAPLGWREWVGEGGDVIGIERFGASAEHEDVFEHYGFTVDAVAARARRLLGRLGNGGGDG
jgi:transketolase